MLKFNKLTVAMLSAIALTACGGGGGSDSNEDNPNPNPNPDSAVLSYVLPVQVNTQTNSVRGGNSGAAGLVQSLDEVESQGSDDSLVVCIDTNDDDSCLGESVTAPVNQSGIAELKWTAKDLVSFTGMKIISVQSNGSVMQFKLGDFPEPTLVNNVYSFKKLFLNPLSSTQSRIGSVKAFKDLIGDTSTAVQDFATADPANFDDSYKALLDILYQEGMTYNKVIKANGIEHTISGNYEKITAYLRNNTNEGARLTLVTEVMKAIAKGEADPFANLGNGVVSPDNHIPTADFSYSADGLTVTFTSTSTDPDEDILEYTWNFGDGSAVVSDEHPVHTYAKPGSYDVSLMVSDGSLSNYISQTVKVTAGGDNPVAENTPPVASFSYKTNQLKVTFTNSSSDADGDLLTSVWNFGDGNKVLAKNDSSFTYTFAKAGTYKVTLTVDDGVDSHTVSQEVTVKSSGGNTPVDPDDPTNHAPAAAFDAASNGLTVSLTNASTDEDNDNLTYMWDFGDGATSTDASPTHTYKKAGTYKIVLTVSDGKASRDTSRTVEVKVPDPDDPEALKCTLD